MTLINHSPKPGQQVPEWAVELPATVPDTVYSETDEADAQHPGLYDLMLAHPDKLGEIGDRLIAQLGEQLGKALYDDAEREAMHSMKVDALRIDLHNAIHEIRQQALKAAATIARLESDNVYDIHIAESADTPYLKSFIEDIRKAGIAAHAILPFDENGDLK